jgi:hypothetical protein
MKAEPQGDMPRYVIDDPVELARTARLFQTARARRLAAEQANQPDDAVSVQSTPRRKNGRKAR